MDTVSKYILEYSNRIVYISDAWALSCYIVLVQENNVRL